LYTVLAGGGASVVRAAVMGGVALVARETGRPGSAATALGLAVAGLLLLDPQMAPDVGFQLSVAATAGLLAWGTPLTERLRRALPARGGRWLAETLGVSLAAQAATLPLILLHFGRLSLLSPLANLLVAPLVAPAMLVGVLALGAGLAAMVGVPGFAVAPLAAAAWLVLGAMVGVADLLASLPLASVTLPPPLDHAAAVVAGATVLGVVARARLRSGADVGMAAAPAQQRLGSRASHDGRRRPRGLLIASAGACIACLLAAVGVLGIARPTPRLVLTVMDVGQGDAVLVEGPRGARLLIDGGPDPDRLLAVLDGILPAWDRRIDLAVLSHPHEDHVAGLAVLLERYRVGTIAENGMLGTGPGDAAFRRLLAARGVDTVRLAAGDRLDLDGARLTVLWPRRGSVPRTSPTSGREVNDTSIVLDARFGDRRLLLTGDIEEDVDPELLAAGVAADGERLDVLKVAHHGSGSATSDAFLDALEPRVTLVSAGLGNPYGHPAQRTIERLLAHRARVLRTDLDGTLRVATDGTDLQVWTTGGRGDVAAGRARSEGSARLASPLAESGQAIEQAAPSFLCSVPLSSIPGLAGGPVAGPSDVRAARGRPVRPPPDPLPVRALEPCYDRTRDDPVPAERREHSAGAVALTPPAAPRVRGGRDRGVPRPPGPPPRRRRGPPSRGVRGPPPRPRQGAAGDPSAPRAGPRARGRALAHRARRG
jgi:competence protein ComEC